MKLHPSLRPRRLMIDHGPALLLLGAGLLLLKNIAIAAADALAFILFLGGCLFIMGFVV